VTHLVVLCQQSAGGQCHAVRIREEHGDVRLPHSAEAAERPLRAHLRWHRKLILLAERLLPRRSPGADKQTLV
jgi:hypothetical protein